MRLQFNFSPRTIGRPTLQALALCLSAPAALAQNLTWDAGSHGVNTSPNAIPASGNWDTNTLNWNNSAADVAWTQTSGTAPLNNAIFGGPDGAYSVTNVVPVAATNIYINASGYNFSGSGIYLAASGGLLAVAAGKTVTISCPMVSGNHGQAYWVGAGAALSFTGNFGGQQPHFGGPLSGTVYLGGINVPSVTYFDTTVDITNGSLATTGFFVGYSVAVNGTNYNTGDLTISGGATVTQNGGNIIVARGGGVGTLTLLDGTLNAGVSGSTPRSLAICNDGSGSEHGVVNIYGGTVNVGVPGSTILNGRILLSPGGSAAGEYAVLNQTNGVINAWGGLEFGAATGSYTGGAAALTNSGGSLFVGPGGIIQGAFFPPAYNLTFSGGIVGALADWASTLPITLGTNNGNITFQCADAKNNSHGIALSGVLSGPGGLDKTGGGTLTLSGPDTFSGVMRVAAGELVLNGGGQAANSSSLSLTNGGALILYNGAGGNLANRLNGAAPITMDGGVFGFMNDGSASSFNATAGVLNISSGVNVVTVDLAAAGQTSTLTFSALDHTGGSVDFQMGGVGTSANRVFFTAPPTPGTWLTVNGGPAAYDSVNGLIPAGQFIDIAALGSTITNAPGGNVRINSSGTGGNIQLRSATTTINSLQQNTGTAATVGLAGETLEVSAITVNPAEQTLTIGSSPGSGVLTAAGVGGTLSLANNSGFVPGLVVNAALADNLLPSSLVILGGGMVTLAAPDNSFSGGITISNGILSVATGTTVAMPCADFGGTLAVNLGAPGATLPMSSFFASGTGSQLTFNMGGVGSSSPLVNIGGSLTLNGDVRINVTNPIPGTGVLLQYSGSRSGSGRFLPGNVPAGAGIVDDPLSRQVCLVYISGPTVIVPPHDTNAIVVAVMTPQQFGAVGDGVTDDSAAFQNAINAVNNSGAVGGGVVYVPSGVYAFSNSLSIPPGVTLQGDWTDWSQGTNGVLGTLLKVYPGAGQSNGTPFITINQGALKGVSIWYPNQNPAAITPYPFTLSIQNADAVVQDVALINSYQGIWGNLAAQHVFSRVVGSPLYTGIQVDAQYDISQQEDVRFSPAFWSLSLLPGAPAANGPHAAWMRANGTAERLYRADGEACLAVNISGYNVGYYALQSTNGGPDTSFYASSISNCATAFFDAAGGGNTGMEFTDVALDGDTAVDRNSTNSASAFFHTCQLTSHTGTALHMTGGSGSKMQFQNCTVSGTVKLDGGFVDFVNSSLTVPAGSNHCVMASGAIYAAFTGCSFTPARSIVNAADSRRLVVDGRRSSTSPLPCVKWADIQNDWLTRRPASVALFFATNAVGDGMADDTAAIQGALNAAGAAGGGIVYLPAGKYKLTGTLDVPGGVELRGSFPSRHSASLYDGHVKVTVLQPYAGAGTTNGPPAVALEANAGVLGLTITYELQNTNATPYPPAIQGRGANVYAYGIMCPNAYWYVDADTCTCTNHLFYQVDGWALDTAFMVGNGSTGSIIECMANPSYWDDNDLSASQLGTAALPMAPIQNFAEHNLNWFLLGDCTELMVKNFDYLSHSFMHCVSQNGRGPWVTGVLTMCDAAVECFRFEAAAPCQIDIVNPEWMVTLADYPDLTGYGVISTPAFQGTARFFNAPLWGSRLWDYVVQGGDVGFEITHSSYLSVHGSQVAGGVLHLINSGLEGNTSSFYTVPFNSPSPGVPGKLSEIIGCYAWTGVTNSLANTNNPLNIWGNFGLNNLLSQPVFTVAPPILKLRQNAADQAVSLMWTNNMGAFNLYAAPDLTPTADWILVTGNPYFGANQWTVVDATTNAGQRFYRLGP